MSAARPLGRRRAARARSGAVRRRSQRRVRSRRGRGLDLAFDRYRARAISTVCGLQRSGRSTGSRREVVEIAWARYDDAAMSDPVARITSDPSKCGGRPCIRGMRIRVSDILDLLANGLSAQQVIGEFPDLELADIEATARRSRARRPSSNSTPIRGAGRAAQPRAAQSRPHARRLRRVCL